MSIEPVEYRGLEYEAFMLQDAPAEVKGGAVIVEVPRDFFMFIDTVAAAVYHARVGMDPEVIKGLSEYLIIHVIVVGIEPGEKVALHH